MNYFDNRRNAIFFCSESARRLQLLLSIIYKYLNDLDRYRFKNSILFFKLPEFEEKFLLFLLGDVDEFDVNNPPCGCEKYLRIARVLVDKYGYDYLAEIKNEQALKAANERVRDYLYDENDISRTGYKIMQTFKMLSGYDEE